MDAQKEQEQLGRFEHGGNIHKLIREKKVDRNLVLDFSANINPVGPPAWFRSLLNREMEGLSHYPDPHYHELRETIARAYRVDPGSVVVANGSSELLYLLPNLIPGGNILIPVPCYLDYLAVFESPGFSIEQLVLQEEDGFAITMELLERHLHGKDAVIFGNPANPAGSFLKDERIIELAARFPATLFIVDEAFHEFTGAFSTVGGKRDNIVTLNSLTKFFGIPGLRIGFGIFPEPYGEHVGRTIPRWSVNTLAEKMAIAALADTAYCSESRRRSAELRSSLKQQLDTLKPLTIFDSAANYLLVKLLADFDADELYRRLLERNIVIRRCENYPGLDSNYFRIAVRQEADNNRIVDELGAILEPKHAAKKPGRSVTTKTKARSLMFQGTSSNAGKSIMAAAFCRIFVQDGMRVAPFKAQNMSLNSHVTPVGDEMGRAQVVQAAAAKVIPDSRMNPVLLKPNSDTGSQVIINGKPVGNMHVRQYHAYKPKAWEAVTASYDELSGSYDVIVLEGAGSPGEINLKSHDIVNMKMAAYARSPVLLVGDIDRGGVYASFAGTLDVLEEWERRLIAGFVVNKFRGDVSLLDDAHTFLKNHTGKDVFGVVPYLMNMTIPQEDSVALREGFYQQRAAADQQVEIAVIDLPHISNFTDIDPLYFEPDVTVRFVEHSESLGRPEAVILPGSKNVASDLAHLRKSGLDKAIIEYAARGGRVIGICGGYQMLGRDLRDPHAIETTDPAVPGLGLIDIDTVLEREKTLTKRTGTHLESGHTISGYEIHHGISTGNEHPVLSFGEGEYCGSQNDSKNIWGAYLHGIFDEDQFRRWFIDQLRQDRDLEPVGEVVAPYDLDKSLDDLAAAVRTCFEMDKIYQLIGY